MGLISMLTDVVIDELLTLQRKLYRLCVDNDIVIVPYLVGFFTFLKDENSLFDVFGKFFDYSLILYSFVQQLKIAFFLDQFGEVSSLI